MKHLRLFSLLTLASVTLLGTGANLSVTCDDGTGIGGNCAAGRVTFSSPNFNGIVHINVTRNANSAVYDDFDYDATSGHLQFTESLIPGGSYTVTITATNGNTFTQTVTTGS